jgi:hypothetical protein
MRAQFEYDSLNTDPTDIARRDYLEFFVERILEISGDCSKVSSLQFKVKWLGYDESCPRGLYGPEVRFWRTKSEDSIAE